jgi:heme/copper-type cytochrome/quinol oxidase subunit 2
VNTTYSKNAIQSNAIKGDATGYQWNHLFNYDDLEVSEASQIEACAYLGTGSPLISAQKYKTVIPLSALSNDDWHMFTFSIDPPIY